MEVEDFQMIKVSLNWVTQDERDNNGIEKERQIQRGHEHP